MSSTPDDIAHDGFVDNEVGTYDNSTEQDRHYLQGRRKDQRKL
jgi:hypothetical protein